MKQFPYGIFLIVTQTYQVVKHCQSGGRKDCEGVYSKSEGDSTKFNEKAVVSDILVVHY